MVTIVVIPLGYICLYGMLCASSSLSGGVECCFLLQLAADAALVLKAARVNSVSPGYVQAQLRTALCDVS